MLVTNAMSRLIEKGMEFEVGKDEEGRTVFIVKAEGKVTWVNSKSDPDGTASRVKLEFPLDIAAF